MATTVDTKAVAGALYDALIGTAVEQLKAAAPKLAGASGADLAARIDAALPPGALPQVRSFLVGLANEGLLGQVDEIAAAFAGFLAGPPSQALDAQVTSATPLSEAQRERIAADLRQRYGSDLKLSFAVDESLIGGLVIRVGDQVLDNSLRTRLSAIQRNMITS